MILLFVAILGVLQAVQAPPDTEIVVAALSQPTRGALTIGTPENVTRSPGYDNQPSFTPDGRAMLFTSNRGGAQTDIYRYDFDSKQVSRVTETPESEYSPTITPDGTHISVVRVEGDGTQRLWRFTLDGRQPEVLLTNVKPVGYHAWIDDHTLALFVLGQPATLQIADTRTGKAEIAARNIGRTIQRMPGGRTISFVERSADGSGAAAATLLVREFDPATKAITTLTKAVAGVTEAYYAWTPDGTLLMADSGGILAWRRGDTDWSRIANLTTLGVRGVSRMAVSPRGDRIALVIDAAR